MRTAHGWGLEEQEGLPPAPPFPENVNLLSQDALGLGVRVVTHTGLQGEGSSSASQEHELAGSQSGTHSTVPPEEA